MTRFFASLLVLALFVSFASSDDAKSSEAQKAYQTLSKEVFAKIAKAKEADARKEVIQEFTDKFLAHAKDHANDPSAVEALVMALRMNPATSNSDVNSTVLGKLKDLAKDATNRPIKAAAIQALVKQLDRDAQTASRLRSNAKMRETYEEKLGKDKVRDMLSQADKNKDLVKEYKTELRTKFSDLVTDLSVGSKAPETTSVDLNGQKVKLSDLKGKVVVLDFWATWCPPCRAMIPHSRELTKKMKIRPFVLIGISADAKKESVVSFQEKTPMPWTQWWDGQSGPATKLWEVEAFPTLYVVDHKGVIRHKSVGFNSSDKTFDELLERLVKAAEEDKKTE